MIREYVLYKEIYKSILVDICTYRIGNLSTEKFMRNVTFRRVITTTILIPVAVMKPQHSKFTVLNVALQSNEHKGEEVRIRE